MLQYFQQVDRQWVVVFGILMSVAGFFVSRALISMGMVILVANAVFHPRFINNLRSFCRSPLYLSITLIFFIVLVSGLYSTNIDYWLARLRIKVPFLLLPFAFAFLQPFSQKKFYLTLYIFFGVMVGSTLGILNNYLGNVAEIASAYTEANVIQTPFHHIRYSLMLAFCIAIALHCYVNKIYIVFKREPLILLGLSIYLFVFLHLLAVRSGMLAAYIVLLVFMAYIILSMKQYKLGVSLLLALFALPLLAYWTIPTLQSKIQYMAYDLRQYYNHGNVKNLSDSKRLVSYEMGLKASLQQPLIGLGYGDIKSEIKTLYQKEMPKLPQEDRMLPHNQFIMVSTGAGIIGLILFLGSIFYPLLSNRHYREPLFLSFNLILFSSFMTEFTLEVQIGTAFYLLFLLFLLKQPAFSGKWDPSGKEC